MNAQTLSRATILLVDDRWENLDVLFTSLKRYGCKLLVARNGEDALDIVHKSRPDIIVLDILMPGLDGYETCRRLKADPATKPIPILFISSLTDPDDIVKGFEAGGVDYIHKPFNEAEALARITTHVTLYAAQRELVEKNARLEQNIAERELTTALHRVQGQQEEITRLTKFPDENPNPVLRMTRDGTILYANSASQPLLHAWGIHANNTEPGKQSPRDALPEGFLKALVAVSVSGEKHDMEVSYAHRTFVLTMAPIMDAGYINVYGFDITDRKQAEEALRASEQKLQTLFDALPVGISILDQDHTILTMNAALERILDISHAELIEKQYTNRTYLRHDGTPMPSEEFPSARAGHGHGAVQGVEVGIIKEDGDTIWTNVSAAPLPFHDWHVLVTTTDITEHKLMEQARLREAQSLEQFSRDSKSAVTAESLRIFPLHQAMPDLFQELLTDYKRALALALEEYTYKVEHHISEHLRALAERLGSLRANPRDVVNLHVMALKQIAGGQSARKIQAYTDTGRVTLLELMGSLVSYYRLRSWQTNAPGSSDPNEEDDL